MVIFFFTSFLLGFLSFSFLLLPVLLFCLPFLKLSCARPKETQEADRRAARRQTKRNGGNEKQQDSEKSKDKVRKAIKKRDINIET
jgi:type III secretory pathway component EscV